MDPMEGTQLNEEAIPFPFALAEWRVTTLPFSQTERRGHSSSIWLSRMEEEPFSYLVESNREEPLLFDLTEYHSF